MSECVDHSACREWSTSDNRQLLFHIARHIMLVSLYHGNLVRGEHIHIQTYDPCIHACMYMLGDLTLCVCQVLATVGLTGFTD